MSISTATQFVWLSSYVRTLMTAIMGAPAEPDSDGDFPLQGDTSRAWVRPERHDPPGVEVFAVAAHGVPDKAAVLREINATNSHVPVARVVLRPGGVIMVHYRLLADAVTEDNLRGVINHVLTVADEIGPMLTAMHGGSTPIVVEPFVER